MHLSHLILLLQHTIYPKIRLPFYKDYQFYTSAKTAIRLIFGYLNETEF